MSYIGKTPTIGNFQVCDAISVVNGQAAYTMQVNSVNVVPESANHMLVSLNGILQKPGGSFTVSGSTITFASNLATGDVIDFITLLGNVLDLGTPSDATVTNAKTNFTSTSSAAGLQIKGDGTTDGTLQLNCSQNSHGIKLASPAHSAGQSYTVKFPTGNITADKFLKVASISGSGTSAVGQLSFADAGGGGAYDFIAKADYSSAVSNITISNCFTSSYQVYKVIGHNISAANDNKMFVQCLDSSNNAIDGWRYVDSLAYVSDDGSSTGDTNTGGGTGNYFKYINYNFSGNTTRIGSFNLDFYQPYENSYTQVCGTSVINSNNSHSYRGGLMSYLGSTTSNRSLKFYTSGGGNFSGYKITIFGLRRS